MHLRTLWISGLVLAIAATATLIWRAAMDECGYEAYERDYSASPKLVACAEVGDPKALTYLGILNWSASAGPSPDLYGLDAELSSEELKQEGRRLFERAAETDDGTMAQNELGLAYLDGTYGITQDYKRAREYLELADAGGDELAPINLARIHAGGFGVTANLPLALSYLNRSADRGYADAICYTKLWSVQTHDGSRRRTAAGLSYLLESDTGHTCDYSSEMDGINDLLEEIFED